MRITGLRLNAAIAHLLFREIKWCVCCHTEPELFRQIGQPALVIGVVWMYEYKTLPIVREPRPTR